MRIDFVTEQVPAAAALLKLRRLLERIWNNFFEIYSIAAKQATRR
jgi:hypothetical protein